MSMMIHRAVMRQRIKEGAVVKTAPVPVVSEQPKNEEEKPVVVEETETAPEKKRTRRQRKR